MKTETDKTLFADWMRGRISRVATPEECAQWDAEQQRKAEEQKAQEEKQRRIEQKRAELRGLFANAYVHTAANETFRVEFTNLTEQQVRELAEKLKAS